MNQEAIFSIYLTIKIVIVDILLLLGFGTLLVYFLIEEKSIFKKIISILIDLPLIFPPIATGFLLLWLLRNNGYIGYFLNKLHIHLVFGFWGLVLAGFIAAASLYIKPLVSAIRQFPKSILEASYVSGKNRFTTFFLVLLPNMKRVFVASFVLSISRVFGEVGISLMIGGNIPFKTNTISIEIFSSVFNGDLNTAFRLSLLMFIVSIVLFTILKIFESNIKI